MNLQQMKYVICTAECGSISNAARKLFVTQPSLSSAIKDLEQELNIQIFERKNSGVSITQDGIIFIGQISSIFEQMQTIDAYYKKSKESEHILSVACQHSSFVPEAVAKCIKGFEKESYQVQILEVKTKEVLEYLQLGICDIGILLKNQKNKVLDWEMEQKKIEFQHVASLKPHVFMNKKHPLANKKKIVAEDLKPYPYSKYFQGTDSMRFFSEELIENPSADKVIILTDKQTDTNLGEYLNSYTLGSGIRSNLFSCHDSVAIPYESDEIIDLGWVMCKDKAYNSLMIRFREIFMELVKENGIG